MHDVVGDCCDAAGANHLEADWRRRDDAYRIRVRFALGEEGDFASSGYEMVQDGMKSIKEVRREPCRRDGLWISGPASSIRGWWPGQASERDDDGLQHGHGLSVPLSPGCLSPVACLPSCSSLQPPNARAFVAAAI